MRRASVPFHPLSLALPLILSLVGCGEGQAPAAAPGKAFPGQGDAGYLAPPAVISTKPTSQGVRVVGQAPAGSRVRLATPEGEAQYAEAGAKGDWALELPASTKARIFGLSSTLAGRLIQSEGYLLLTPAGEPVLLRAGAGALRVARSGKNGVDAVDFDREGGAVISGRAPAGTALSILVDGRKFAEGKADSKGRYALSMTQQPLVAGRRQIDVFGDATENPVIVDATPAPPLSSGPFRASNVDAGLRIDWMTPGGGAQSTILLK